MQGGAPQVLADRARTQVWAICDSRARHFHPLVAEGSLLEVCGASYYIHELQGLLVSCPRDEILTETVTVALQTVYDILRTGLATRSS